MNQPAANGPRGQVTLLDCLSVLGLILGSVGGAIWGYREFGFVGGIVGVPIGAVCGVVTTWLFVLLLVVGFVGVLAVRALLQGGAKGLTEFFREGPDWEGSREPTPGT